MSKKTRAFSVLSIATLLLTGTLNASTAGATSALTATPGGHDRRYADYLSEEAGADVGLATVGEDQCAKPLEQRTGAWMCMDEGAMAEAYKNGTAPTLESSSSKNSSTAAAKVGFCRPNICWYYENTAKSELHGSGPYGYGKETLGVMEFNANFVASGGKIDTNNLWMKSTRNIKDGYITGNRLYISSDKPKGAEVNVTPPAYAIMGPCQTPAGWLCETKYASVEKTVQTTSQVHQWTWHTANYPGRWYVYAKSIVAKKQKNVVAYYFDKNGKLPGDPSTGAWSPDY